VALKKERAKFMEQGVEHNKLEKEEKERRKRKESKIPRNEKRRRRQDMLQV